LINKFNVKENNVFISPSGGVNIELFNKAPINKDNKKFIIGYASGLDDSKGANILYEIIKKYKELENRIKSIIEYNLINYAENKTEKYKKKNKEKKKKKKKKKKMKKEEMTSFYNTMDLLIMPSLGESLGLVALEAMSCDIPIITFDICAFPDFVLSNISGERVEYKSDFNENVKNFIEAIVLVKENYNSYRARNLIVEKYSENTVIENYKNIFE
jgi:glycosyltransferase involved in cell wall biosynthesis